MKTRSYTIALVLAVALVSAWTAVADDMNLNVNMNMFDKDSTPRANTNGIYLSGDAGISIMQSMTAQGIQIQYHVGPRVDLSAGYNLRRNVAVELQGGFAYNSWSSVNSLSIGVGNSAYVWTVPVMANGIYKYSFNDHWQAYGGLGAGVLVSTLHISEPGFNVSVGSTDCEFGYQAMVGIRCIIDDHFEWGVGYQFLGSLDHHWDGVAGPGENLTTSPTYMHSVFVSLTYRF